MQSNRKPSSYLSIKRGSSHVIKFEIRKYRLFILIRNFGNDGEIKLTIRPGEISGSARYFRGPVFFSTVLKPDGEWSGRFIKQIKKEKVAFNIRNGKISCRRIGQLTKILQGDSSVLVDLGMDRGAHNSGRKRARFRVKLMVSSRHEVFGFIKHSSPEHYTRINLKADGTWNTQGWTKYLLGKFLFSAEKGKYKLDFEGAPLAFST